MKKLLASVLITILFAAGCSKEDNIKILKDDQGVVISMPFEWSYFLHESGNFYSNGYFDVPIMYNGRPIIPTTCNNGKQRMTMIDPLDATEVWHWNDIFPESLSNFNIYTIFISNNLLTWQVANRSYGLNMLNGSTNWKILRDSYFEDVFNSFGTNYFVYSNYSRLDGYDEHIAYIGNIQTGEIEEFLRGNYSMEYIGNITDNGWVGGITYINEIHSNKNLLLVTYTEPLPGWALRMMFGLYNVETEEWVYERKQLVEPHWNAGVQSSPIIYDNKVYAAAGYSIVCHDVMTGEQLWRRDFPQDFLFSGFIIEDGMLIANCEDTFTYRLDPDNGNIVWKTEGAGTCSRISYLNGVVYFVGGSTGYLHALDAYTGEVLWRIDAETYEGYGNYFVTNAVYVIPGKNGQKGKVIALTNLHAYCFEAYR